MYIRQTLLQLKRFLTAMFLFAVGVVIVFSSVNGNDASAETTEASIESPVSKTVKTGTEKGITETSNVDVKTGSGTPTQPEIQEERPVTTRPERSMSIGVRKIYAPESEALRWPLGNKKYTYINAEKFESKYKLWKNILLDKSSDLLSEHTPPDAYIESARYYGTVSESGDLSGWGEWKVVVNNRKPEFKNEDNSLPPSSRIISNSENGASTTNGNAVTLDSRLKATASGTGNVELYLTSDMKILLTDFVFYDSSVENLPEPNAESKTEEPSPMPVDSEFRYPVEKDIISASFPGGRDVLYIPSSGTIRFRWKAKRIGLNDFQIQSFGSVESLWTIDVPSNQQLSVRSDVLESESAPLCASVSKEKIGSADSWRYSIRWSESDLAVVRIASADGKENRFERFYQQQTTYTFTPYHLNTQCRITFEPSSRFGLPQEIPFSVEHDPHVIWEATLDGQPAEIHITESGYVISLRQCKTENPRPELLITSNFPLADVKNEAQESDKNASLPSDSFKLRPPRIDLKSGIWQSGSAVIYTLQSPMSIETSKCNVVDFKRDSRRRYQTTVEQESSDSDIVLIIEPFKELFYSQTQTIVQWDGSQASFTNTIELQAEEGRLYSLNAVLPEGLIIDQATSDEQPDMIEDWEVYPDAENPAKRTLTIYLRKSLCPGRNLVLNIRAHAIADWSKPVELNRLSPIVFERFESHTQILYVNVALNQRFVVGQRVLYSPELRSWESGTIDDSAAPELPIGIECSPHTTSGRGMGTGRIDAYEFCIDLKMWGNCLASLEPAQSDYAVNAHATIWVDKNSMEEKLELAFSGELSHLNQFRFSFDQSSETPSAWQGELVWSNNRYKVKAEPVEGNVYSIEIPRNVSGPFTIFLNRKTDWKQQRVIDVLKSNDCSRLTATVSVCSRRPQLFDVHTEGMKCVNDASENNSDFTIGTFEYDLINEKQELRNDGDSSPASAASALPCVKISESKAPQSDVSIWAWDQVVEERHFASGNVLTSAQWTIENRYPPLDADQASDSSNTRLKVTLPADSTTQTSLTGVRIDNESVSGENIIQDAENSFFILLPKKKLFVLTVQWTRYDKQMNNYCSFEPQKPILNIDVLQSSWNLYYPTSYRRLNSYMSSDPSVDGWLERFFGPLLRRDTPPIMEIVSQMWDDVQIGAQNQDVTDRGKENRDSASINSSSLSGNVKSESSSTLPVPYMLSGRSAWNCSQFDGRDAPKIIRMIRSEVSECIRWTFFIVTISTILTFYFKRVDLLRLVKKKNEKQDADKPQSASWGFRRWVCIFGGVCGVLCQTLPWFLSLAFSGAFLGTLVCLLVLAVPFDYEKNNDKDELTSLSKNSAVVKTSSRVALPVSRLFFIAVLFLFQQTALGQVPVLPGPDSRFIPPESPEFGEYEIFVPVDRQNRPKSGYYVPQELLDLMQTRDNFSPERSWIVCRTQYFGKLIQKPRQTEAGLWKCAVEIETLVPNAAIELPVPLQETLSSTSSVSVSRGRILKPSKPKTDEDESENLKSETLYWSWDKLDYQTVLQWNPKKDRWGIRLAQPGRYLIEAEFRPTIIAIDGKNEISFSIFECINSTFELIVPENITGLEFPDSYGAIKELTPNTEITDPSIPAQPGLKLKRVELGAAKRLSVRWNAGGFLSDGPVYDVDSMIWWNVEPDKADVRIKYNVKVVSGSVSSIEIKTDERLALLSDFSDDKQKKNNGVSTEENLELPSNKELESGDDSSINESRKPGNGLQNSTSASRSSALKTNSDASQSDVHYSVIPNPDKPGTIRVEFDRPITSQSQASFELHFIWKDALGVGRLQFPTTSVESSRSGQRTLAFTFDPELQFECASDSLSPMSAQSFGEQWRSFQKQISPVTDNDSVSTDRGNGRIAMDSVPDVSVDSDSAASRLSLPSLSQTSADLPTVAYDLNLSRRKTDSSGILDNVVMNVQRTKPVSDGTVEAFVLADCNRLLWQIKWSINITRGEYSGYNATLPDSFCKPENHLSIISASISSFDNGVERVNTVSTCIEGNELKMYWGTPIEGKCQLTLTGEIRPDFDNEKPDSTRKINFDFPEIKTLNVTQYKLALGRADDSLIKTVFDKPTTRAVVWTQTELSVESPFSSRNQRLMETWQTTINDSSKKPCAFTVEIQRNEVAAEIDASVKLVQDGAAAMTINGRVKISHGVLDEFQLDIPENCAAPVSSKTTLKCELDALSITQRRYILRPLSPFTSDSEFELTIPLKKMESGAWKLEKQAPALWSLVRSGDPQRTGVQASKPKKENPSTSKESKDALAETRSSDSVTKVFGLKMIVKPASEAEYCASAEFACCVSGADCVRVRLPKRSKPLNIQIEQSSVRWIENKDGEIVIPMFTENAPVDIRIVYTAPFNRTLYTDPMKFDPPTIEDASQPEILWMVIPWKSFGSADPGAVRVTSFINKQIWLINDLNSQFQFLQQSSGETSFKSMARLSSKLDAIEAQLKQYELRGEKPKTKNSSSLLLPKPDSFRRPNLTSTETKAISLAMQNVYLLRGLINEKLKSFKNNRKTVNSFSSSINDSELLEFQPTPPLVGTSAPGTAFVLSHSLPPAPAPSASIWQMLSMLFIPVIIWLTFFPPEPFIIWRPPFVLCCLSVIWLLCFNLYGVSILLFIVALFDALNKFRQRTKRNVIPLSVR